MFLILLHYLTKTQYEAIWLKIFHHNSNGGIFFTNESNAKKSNLPNLYSIFWEISNKFKIEGYFEFLLEYPELIGYNRWKQNVFPLEALKTDSISYIPIQNTWTGFGWKGLYKSSRPESTLIDGTSDLCCWFFSIGSYGKYYSPRFPGPNIDGYAEPTVQEAILWLRITDLSILNSYQTSKKSLKSINLFQLLIFCI